MFNRERHTALLNHFVNFFILKSTMKEALSQSWNELSYRLPLRVSPALLHSNIAANVALRETVSGSFFSISRDETNSNLKMSSGSAPPQIPEDKPSPYFSRVIGHRQYVANKKIEDRIAVEQVTITPDSLLKRPNQVPAEHKAVVITVLDGHGGPQVAEFVEKNLSSHLQRAIVEASLQPNAYSFPPPTWPHTKSEPICALDPDEDIGRGNDHPFSEGGLPLTKLSKNRPKLLAKALEAAYMSVDRMVESRLRVAARSGHLNLLKAGSCGLTVIMDNDHYVIANSGDCKALLIRRGDVIHQNSLSNSLNNSSTYSTHQQNQKQIQQKIQHHRQGLSEWQPKGISSSSLSSSTFSSETLEVISSLLTERSCSSPNSSSNKENRCMQPSHNNQIEETNEPLKVTVINQSSSTNMYNSNSSLTSQQSGSNSVSSNQPHPQYNPFLNPADVFDTPKSLCNPVSSHSEPQTQSTQLSPLTIVPLTVPPIDCAPPSVTCLEVEDYGVVSAIPLNHLHNSSNPREAIRVLERFPSDDTILLSSNGQAVCMEEVQDARDAGQASLVHSQTITCLDERGMPVPKEIAVKKSVYLKGCLQPTRSFGDVYLKRREFARETPSLSSPVQPGVKGSFPIVPLPHDHPYIDAAPELSLIARNHEDDLCIVIASDGLWDVLTDEDVAKVTLTLLKTLTPQGCADGLLELCLHKCSKEIGLTMDQIKQLPPGSRRRVHDDMSIVVVSQMKAGWKLGGNYD